MNQHEDLLNSVQVKLINWLTFACPIIVIILFFACFLRYLVRICGKRKMQQSCSINAGSAWQTGVAILTPNEQSVMRTRNIIYDLEAGLNIHPGSINAENRQQLLAMLMLRQQYGNGEYGFFSTPHQHPIPSFLNVESLFLEGSLLEEPFPPKYEDALKMPSASMSARQTHDEIGNHSRTSVSSNNSTQAPPPPLYEGFNNENSCGIQNIRCCDCQQQQTNSVQNKKENFDRPPAYSVESATQPNCTTSTTTTTASTTNSTIVTNTLNNNNHYNNNNNNNGNDIANSNDPKWIKNNNMPTCSMCSVVNLNAQMTCASTQHPTILPKNSSSATPTNVNEIVDVDDPRTSEDFFNSNKPSSRIFIRKSISQHGIRSENEQILKEERRNILLENYNKRGACATSSAEKNSSSEIILRDSIHYSQHHCNSNFGNEVKERPSSSAGNSITDHNFLSLTDMSDEQSSKHSTMKDLLVNCASTTATTAQALVLSNVTKKWKERCSSLSTQSRVQSKEENCTNYEITNAQRLTTPTEKQASIMTASLSTFVPKRNGNERKRVDDGEKPI